MSFKRTIEDFTCEQCGTHVSGDGYTNHCPECLYSKHVDVEPGDRAATCLGLMKPIGIEGASPEYTVVHSCVKCGLEKRNKVHASDNIKTILRIAGKER